MRLLHLFLFLLAAVIYLTTGAPLARAAVSRAPKSTARHTESKSVLRTEVYVPSQVNRPGDFSAGIQVGEPTGVSIKSWTGPRTAFDIAFAYSFGGFYELMADYLWHFPALLASITSGKISSSFVPYAGVGGEVFFYSEGRASGRRTTSSNAGFGARVPLGIEFLPVGVPLGFFAELAPGLALAPGVFGFLEGSVGARYYF